MTTYEALKNKYKTLCFNNIAKNLQELLEIAETQELSYLQFAELLVDKEINIRNENRKKFNLKKAQFPFVKSLEEFDFSCQTTITKRQVNSLLDFTWIDNRENLVFYGPSGIGKSHLSISIAIKAISRGYKVLFRNSQELMEELDLAEAQNLLKDKIKQFSKFDLIICDEMGYLPWSRKSVFNFFQFINAFYEYRSLIITTNKSFVDWGEFFVDETAATAIIDRIIHHCHIFPMGGESYRLREQINRQKLFHSVQHVPKTSGNN
ncbi:MAG: IS21-like element helper ATPase IstB [Candidatus Margulisbacteria bacterium]|nr:IS21-like element helper ATPase IstB [Candidatus Margulisiibacteriota bacterium]